MSLLRSVHEDVLRRLGNVGVAARRAVENILSGQHRSIHRGLSVEFAGHRPYQPGDDPRHIDWQVFARTDRLDIRQYEEETRLRATLVVDYSGSMGYGDGRKLQQARMLAAALATLMVRQGDAVGLAIVDHDLRSHLPPRSTMPHLLTLLDQLQDQQPGGDTALAPVLESLAMRLRHRGLVILISDCIDDPEPLARSLQLLHHRRQDLRVLQILDNDEEDLSFSGPCRFVGLEDDGELVLDADRVRAHYQATVAAHRAAVRKGCHGTAAVFDHCRSDEDLAHFLVQVLRDPVGVGRR
ncbi:MAG: DUF58 domain-containing protein [Planctomycetota bacterium]|nr:MAG: DUF58 domain-containing protein [Planctomycetota bacterium]